MKHYSACETCWASKERAGQITNGDCDNCNDTKLTMSPIIHTRLNRTAEELVRTLALADGDMKDKIVKFI